MKSHGQFCAVARSLDLLGERWSLLIVRELLSGSVRFNDIRRGIPRVSKTMLSARLKELLDAGVIAAEPPGYVLTEAGLELAGVVRDLGAWGQRWLPRTLPADELDVDALVWDIHRRIRTDELPAAPFVARLEIAKNRARYLLLRRSEVSLCGENPGFPEELRVAATLRTLTAWWRGDISLASARAQGMVVDGKREHVRMFPRWFERYVFAEVGTNYVPTSAPGGR